MSRVEKNDNNIIFEDYPVSKFGHKHQYWLAPQGIQLVAAWRQAGMTIKDICLKIGVDQRTFRAWCTRSPEFEEALTVSREIADTNVVDALYKRAVGFHYDEVTRELVEGRMVEVRRVTKYCPPDTKATLAWLYNRVSESWRAMQQDLDVTVPQLLAVKDVLVTIRKEAEDYTTEPNSKSNTIPGEVTDEY